MSDATTALGELRRLMREFVDARDWRQFHAPKNLSMSLAIEAAELMEHFQWISTEASRNLDAQQLAEVREELADVFCYGLALANELDIDITSAIGDKLIKNEQKYPAAEYRGRYGPRDTSSES